MELMKQPQYQPMSVAEMALSLYAVNEGFLDDVDVDKVVDFEAAMQGYVKSNHGAMIDEINADPKFDDSVVDKLKSAVEDFKQNGSW
jgi:F-type H+-transporting ATPase subunit alpha